MLSNPLLPCITKIVNFEGFNTTNYHLISDNELLIINKNLGQQLAHIAKKLLMGASKNWLNYNDIGL
ncbi:MAG: hypothetical protein BRC38_01820 [Cyanobacteria bacterium QH_6_48_35]|nr:MAG: hypothetical protein BRC38_01820 [Cyanobacteria bacterium QH_6_48_35]